MSDIVRVCGVRNITVLIDSSRVSPLVELSRKSPDSNLKSATSYSCLPLAGSSFFRMRPILSLLCVVRTLDLVP